MRDSQKYFPDLKLTFVETTQVKEGVTCDVYAIENDSTRDLGIVHVRKGFNTPLQKVLSGTKTIETFNEGAGSLTVTDTFGAKRVYHFPSEVREVEVKVGEMMQWEAIEELVFTEICYPPYKEGRFENIL